MTLTRRIAVALGLTAVVGVLAASLAVAGTVGTVVGVVMLAAFTAAMLRWLSRSVNEPLNDIHTALTGLRNSLGTSNPPLLLKSERPDDAIGRLAEETNRVITSTSQSLGAERQRNHQLAQAQSLVQSTLENMVEGVVVISESGAVLYFNETARTMLDFGGREVLGRPLWEILREPGLQTALDQHLSGTQLSATDSASSPARFELELKRLRSVVEVTAARLRQPEVQGAVLVFHEVTELRRLERLRREFVSNVSHELKTPLTSIQAYADTLLEGAIDDPANARMFLERILEQSDRLQNLIQDILRLGRIESQSDAFPLRPVDVTPLLQDCVDARQPLARSRCIDLSLTNETESLFVHADAGGLQTVIENLVSNALNYTAEGGHVNVRSSLVDGQVLIEVADDGVGIPAEHHERIFERFYRVDKARSRGKGGNGLGLAIVKHLVTVFHGTIELTSQPGQGSKFRVQLPVQSVPASQPAHKPG